MILRCQIIVFLLITLAANPLTAQQDPFFMPFEGDVYKLPAKRVMDSKFGYSEDVYDYPKIGEISWKEIKIKRATTDKPFPDVDRIDRFGMVLHSEMIIKQKGCYEFVLSSDDGSVFWIGDKEIINNDQTHKMTMMKDTIRLDEGKYPIKLWYYQGFVNQYGFIFDGTYLAAECPAAKDLSSIGSVSGNGPKKMVINSHHLFDYDSSTLKESVTSSLDSLITELQNLDFSAIEFNGYTCSKGSEKHNDLLSQKRADQLKNYFLSKLFMPGVVFKSSGHGSKNPVASNEIEETRKLNRRVEIVIK